MADLLPSIFPAIVDACAISAFPPILAAVGPLAWLEVVERPLVLVFET